ncbi:MAG: HAMP domain-containing protein [Flavisolibacter sp.]|nr:HAMP domain-containing protein [Flavisolibacter sp.]
MRLNLKTKIWTTVLAIVTMFAFFTLYYFPTQQEKYLLANYNKEIQNLANTVALGVKIALTEQNFEGVETALGFVKEDPHLRFVSLLQVDSVIDKSGQQGAQKTIFKTYPEGIAVQPNVVSSDSIVVKNATFNTPIMNGEIMLGFSTKAIVQSKKQIRLTSIVVSIVVFIIGIIIGFWLARNISVPVLAIRDAANKVGKGDLTQRVLFHTNDEIGELGLAFNKMVDDLSLAQKQVEERTNELVLEKKKSDELLLNILPAETAEELKATGTAKAKYYQSVSVLFADFKGFTQMSERLPPAMLVSELNEVFTAFDRIIQKYEIEKIKTIGDAYMCAGGLPVPNNTHPKDVVNAALEMRDYIHQCNENRQDDIVFEVRLGISTGPVISGIVGLKKFAYDIWGDTVNIAARMETCSEPGRINISGATYELIKDDFYCTYRGKINAKNKGEVDMYFVENIKQTNASYTSSEISVV